MSPRAELFTNSAVANLGKELTEKKADEFQTAARNQEYTKAGQLAEFLANPNFRKDLEEAGVKAGAIINGVLKKYSVEGLDIEFPFDAVEPQERMSLEETDAEKWDKEHDENISISLRTLYAAIEMNDDSNSFRYPKSELPYVILSEEKREDENSRKSVYQTWASVRQDLAHRISEWAEGRERSTIGEFVAENTDNVRSKDVRDFYKRLSALHSERTPDDFINNVLKRKESNDK